MKKISLLLPLAFVLLLSSCSMLDNFGIEKRRYNKGFYVHKSETRSTDPAAQPGTTVDAPEQAVAATPAESPQAAPAVSNPAPAAHADASPQPAAPKKVNAAQQYVPDSKAPDEVTSAPAENVEAQPEAPGATPAGDTELIIMVILAIILSPLAVWMKEGVTNRFWIDLICWILGGGLFFTPFFYGGALLLFAIVFAILIVLDII